MLTVYGAEWCTHCTQTVSYLEQKNIDFKYVDIESAPDDVVQQVIEVNGGDDWVIPTLENGGKWRPGKEFNRVEIDSDLRALGVKLD
ncbi:glutaredoxin domain-containing protein [uncultured Desulfobacter sp.]|uniref:glutaredoxin family protein n=1 Tax=uncultured Desulfobacter sp. TaxID=240139 RepID=UPI0029C644AB|nr:glutaredoxin domain-containing protein [uncultured Desulfobacter sp.]